MFAAPSGPAGRGGPEASRISPAHAPPTSLGQVLTAVEDVANDHSPVIEHTPSRSFDLDRVWLDTSLAEAALGWRATTDIRAGVEATWAWVLAGAPAMR